MAFKGLQGSKEERGEPQRGPSVTTGVTATRDTVARLTSGRHPPSMTQNGLLIARPTLNTLQPSLKSPAGGLYTIQPWDGVQDP